MKKTMKHLAFLAIALAVPCPGFSETNEALSKRAAQELEERAKALELVVKSAQKTSDDPAVLQAVANSLNDSLTDVQQKDPVLAQFIKSYFDAKLEESYQRKLEEIESEMIGKYGIYAYVPDRCDEPSCYDNFVTEKEYDPATREYKITLHVEGFQEIDTEIRKFGLLRSSCDRWLRTEVKTVTKVVRKGNLRTGKQHKDVLTQKVTRSSFAIACDLYRYYR